MFDMGRLQKVIFLLFATLFFFIPLILWPYTSEVFEFNKIVLTYVLTVLIGGAWVARMVAERKIIFSRTILDIPLLVFLASQIISTVLSIDSQTSWFGYYSRFNGGLFSTISYSLLYWAFVSNINKDGVLKLIKYSMIPSAILVSIYGILEHFGIDKNIWVQDVQSRVFSTLGQPNWLAAWLVALIPLTWANTITSFQLPVFKKKEFGIYFSLSILFFITFLFTKSRSGLLGLGMAYVIFWILALWKFNKKILKPLIIITSSLVLISLIIGTQFTPNIQQLLNKKQIQTPETAMNAGPALEVGGTESGTIRKIVWKGALEVWKNYPLFGSGVETFAYAYYQYRPAEHNLVSEWDFIYNKAHNEFLNTAANSGTLGILAYLVLIGFSVYQILKLKDSMLSFALLAGYISLLVTNFFGFSVVPTQLQFFLFPAIAFALTKGEEGKVKKENIKLEGMHKIALLLLLPFTFYILFCITRYWYADYLFMLGKTYAAAPGNADKAVKYLTQAIKLEPKQALYHNEIAGIYTSLALGANQQKDTDSTKKLVSLALSESKKAIDLSPANLNLKRTSFGVYIRLSTIDPNYLVAAGYTLMDAIKYAPTDAKLYYNLALVYARTGQTELALTTLQKTVELKANYKEARLAYAILLNEAKKPKEAKEQLEYILTHIDPNDSLTHQTLESIK